MFSSVHLYTNLQFRNQIKIAKLKSYSIYIFICNLKKFQRNRGEVPVIKSHVSRRFLLMRLVPGTRSAETRGGGISFDV